jgi:hypothetical protein
MCYDSRVGDVDEVKLVAMISARLMIVMYQNNEIQNKEINTARKLKIPILFIYHAVYVQKIYPVNKGEHKIVFKNLEDVAIILKDRFKLIKKTKKQKHFRFKTLVNKKELFNIFRVNSIAILKEKKKFLLAGDKIQFYDLQDNTQQSYEFDKGQLYVCVNNKDKEIIILNNKVFYKYDFDFGRISEDNISELVQNLDINEIAVNEENKHIYGISDYPLQLYHFDEEFKLIETIDILISIFIKVFNNKLYMLIKGYLNSNIQGTNTSEIIENEKSFIGVYSQKENENIKFKRKIVLEFIVAPIDFHVDENYIFIFTSYINKHHLFDFKLNLFLFNHDGILLQKTELDIWSYIITRFLVVDHETIYCAYDETLKKLEFSNFK